MRIEKISDNQIRCTLNKKDLSDRELRISELAYGTDKAKALFRDMMQQASYQFGFEAEDIPLMIEAIPMYPDTLVLVITKVDDPDELDTRFSSFSDDTDDMYDDDFSFGMENNDIDSDLIDDYTYDENLPYADYNDNDDTDFISLSEALGMEPRPKTSEPIFNTDIIRIYSFHNLNDISSLSESLSSIYNGENTLYKDNEKETYYLVLHKSSHSAEEFNTACNIICEYGTSVKNTYASHLYFEEHYEPLIRDNAIQTLYNI